MNEDTIIELSEKGNCWDKIGMTEEKQSNYVM